MLSFAPIYAALGQRMSTYSLSSSDVKANMRSIHVEKMRPAGSINGRFGYARTPANGVLREISYGK
jgi:hypothetical protein